MRNDNHKRIEQARKRLIATLQTHGASIGETSNGRTVVNGIETMLEFSEVGTFPPPGAKLKLRFGSFGNGPRLTVRESKAGFDFAKIVPRVIVWTEQEKVRLDASAKHTAMVRANRCAAERVEKVCGIGPTGSVVRVHQAYRKPGVVVQVESNAMTERQAIKVTKAIQAALR